MKEDIHSYDSPPVNEVAVGIGFHRLNTWNSTAPGEFLQRIGHLYPKVEDKPPLSPMVSDENQQFEFSLDSLPPIRRTWFVSEDNTTLLQVQEDRFHLNWRRVTTEQDYPRHVNVLARFLEVLHLFVSFTQERGEPLRVVAAEMTYVNHIPAGELWSDFRDISQVFSNWSPIPANFQSPYAISMSLAYSGNDSTDTLIPPKHNLTLELKKAKHEHLKKDVLVFQLTDRGTLNTSNENDVTEWAGIARKDIVSTFTRLTSSKAHLTWGRQS